MCNEEDFDFVIDIVDIDEAARERAPPSARVDKPEKADAVRSNVARFQ